MTGEDGVRRRAWSRWIQYGVSVAAILAGLAWRAMM